MREIVGTGAKQPSIGGALTIKCFESHLTGPCILLIPTVLPLQSLPQLGWGQDGPRLRVAMFAGGHNPPLTAGTEQPNCERLRTGYRRSSVLGRCSVVSVAIARKATGAPVGFSKGSNQTEEEERASGRAGTEIKAAMPYRSIFSRSTTPSV
jgi:hypothetical protein